MRPATRVRNIFLTVLGVSLALFAVAGVVLAAPGKPTFSLGVSPTSQSVQQGQTATFTVTLAAANGFTGSVALKAGGLPSDATAVFSPASVGPGTGATSVLKVATARTTPAGSSSLTISGTSGSTKISVTATLSVTYLLNGAYTLSASPSTISVAAGSTAVYTVSVASPNLAGPVRLARYGSWPAGATATFSVNPVQLARNTVTSTLQIKTTRGTTPDGTYPLYIVGTYTQNGHDFFQYAHLQLIVDSKPSAKPFTISGGSPSRSLAPGVGDQPLNLTISNPNNQALPITNLSVSVTGTSRAACAVSNFAVTQYSGPYPLTVPAGATTTLAALGVPARQQPQLRMIDLPTVNQDACKSVSVNLSFSGSAQGN